MKFVKRIVFCKYLGTIVYFFLTVPLLFYFAYKRLFTNAVELIPWIGYTSAANLFSEEICLKMRRYFMRKK